MRNRTRRSQRSATAILGAFLTAALVVALHAEASTNIDGIAATTAKGVGAIHKTGPGKSGAPIVVFEERHDSVVGQLQQAVMLDRLSRDHAFKDLGLEGYLADKDARIDQAGRRLSPENAVGLLERGEISGAEFIALTGSMKIHPIEESADYVRPRDEAMVSPQVYLIAIARSWLERNVNRGTLDPKTMSRVVELEKKLESASAEEERRLIAEFQFSLIEADPWTRRMSERLKFECGKIEPIAEEIEDLVQISKKAKAVGADVPAEYREGLQSMLRFYRAREASSETMVRRALKIRAEPEGGVAMVIGAAHTDLVTKLLKESGRPYAVIAPNALYACDQADETDYEAYSRLVEGKPVEAGILEDALVAVFPPGLIKPQPISKQRWFKARTELVALAEDYVRSVAGGGGGDGKIPARTALAAAGDGDRWRGRFTRIDTTRAVIAVDEGTQERFVVFPMQIQSSTSKMSREVWVRAGLGGTGDVLTLPDVSASSKEKLLMDAIERVEGRNAAKKEAPRMDASGGRPGRQTIARLGSKPIEVTSSRREALQGLSTI